MLVELSGIAFDEVPLPLNVPEVFVIHCDRGVAIFVELKSVYPVPGLPLPVTMKFPPETVGLFSVTLDVPLDVIVN